MFGLVSTLQQVEDYANEILATNTIQWHSRLPYGEGSFGTFAPYDLINIYRKNTDKPSPTVEIAVILHELGHHLSYKYYITTYDYDNKNPPIVVLSEELIAWFIAFILLSKIKIFFLTKIYLKITMFYYACKFFKTYLRFYLPQAGIVQK